MRNRNFVFIVCAVALLGLTVVGYLLPSMTELAALFKKDKYYGKAQNIYEQLYAQGNRSAEVVGALVELYLQNGRVDESVKFLEEYVHLNPTDVTALKEMGKLYQYSQRPDDYLNNLEKLSRLNPDMDTLREMSRVYSYYGLRQKQINVVERIIAAEKPNEDDIIDLAYLYIDTGRASDVNKLVEKYLNSPLDLKHVRNAEFFMSYLLDQNKDKQAIEFATKYLEKHHTVANALRLANRLSLRNREAAAYALIQPFKSELNTNPELLALSADLKVALKMEDEAHDDLKKLYNAGKLPPSLVRLFVELSLDSLPPENLEALAKKVDVRTLSDDTLLKLLEIAASDNTSTIAQQLKGKLDADFLKDHPIIAVTLAITLDKNPRKAELQRLRQDMNLSASTRLRLAKFCLAAGIKDEALALVRTFSSSDNYRDVSMYELANLFVELHEEKRGKVIFDDLFSGKNGSKLRYVESGWALLTVASGNPDQVEKWISKSTTPSLLTDIFYMAKQKKYGTLTLKAAQLLHDRMKTKATDAILAQALILNLKFEQALPLLRKLAAQDSKYDTPYLEALLQASQSSPLDQRADFAEELADYIKKRTGLSKNVPQETVANLLLNAGLKNQALIIFATLAENAGPDSEIVKRLLFIWGPRPSPDKIAWVWKRALSTRGYIQAQWLQHVLDLGEEDKFITYFERKQLDNNNPAIMDIYLNSLLAAHKDDRLNLFMASQLPKEQSARHLTELAKLFRAQGKANLLLAVLQRHAQLYPSKELYNEMATLALQDTTTNAAKAYFAAYFKQGGSGFSNHFIYGGMLLADGKTDLARQHFMAAEFLYPQVSPKGIDEEIMYASVLSLLKKTDQAKRQFARLNKKYPKNKRIQVAYSHMLMDDGLYDEAKNILLNKKG